MIVEDDPQALLAREAPVFQRALYQRFRNQLSWEDVEDITQTALSEKAPMVPRERPVDVQRAWFRSVLRNEAIDYLRHRDGRPQGGASGRGRRLVSLHALSAAVDNPSDRESRIRALAVEDSGYAEAEERIDRDGERTNATALVAQALAELDPEQRRLIELRYRDGLSNRELADRVGLSVKGLEKRWARTWAAFVAVVRDASPADEQCARLRAEHSTGSEVGAVARFEAHMAACLGCQVWHRLHPADVNATMTALHPGFLLGLLSKIGLGGVATRLQGLGDQVAGIAGGGGGAGVVGLVGAKAAATCAVGTVCAIGALAGPVVVSDLGTSKSRPAPQAADSVSPQRTVPVATSRTTAALVGIPAPRTTSTAALSVSRHARVRSAVVSQQSSAARQARALGSPFTPEATDPPQTRHDDGSAVALAARSRAPVPSVQRASRGGSAFSGPFSP